MAPARFNNLTVLKNNTGTFSLLNAATFAATGSFTNSGRLITKTGGSMLVNGAFTNSGTVDLSGAVAVNYTGALPIAGLVSQLQQGYNGGGWDGPLINSSAAAESDATGVGIIESADYIAANANNVFAGHTVDSTAVLMKYTYYGDTDLNGVVNFDDYARRQRLQQPRTGWFNGDFDYSGSINFDDYALIDLAFNTQSGTLVRAMDWLEGEDRSDRGMGDPALRLVQQHFEQFGVVYATSFLHAVPEPGCALVALAGLCVCGRRRRR